MTTGTATCTGTIRRSSTGQPGKSVPVEPISGVDPLRQAVGELVTRVDEYITLATKYDDLEAEDDDDEST
jgi:hypothetical protein